MARVSLVCRSPSPYAIAIRLVQRVRPAGGRAGDGRGIRPGDLPSPPGRSEAHLACRWGHAANAAETARADHVYPVVDLFHAIDTAEDRHEHGPESVSRHGGRGPLERLTDRELEVFTLIGRGKATSTIANQLHLILHTIDSHRETLRHKPDINNGAELAPRAVLWVLENG